MEQTITFLCSFFCEKQENLLDFFRRCFLALVFFLSSNFFVKATLRNWKKKKLLNGYRYFFFVSCPAKHLFDIQRLDSAFLKYSFAPPRLMGSDKPCWWILFHDHFFLVWANLFGKNSWPTTTTKFLFDTKTISFCSKTNKKNFPHRQKMETSGFKWFPHLSRYVAPFRVVLQTFYKTIKKRVTWVTTSRTLKTQGGVKIKILFKLVYWHEKKNYPWGQ